MSLGYGLNFDNTYLHLPKDFFLLVHPQTVQSPEVIMINCNLATSLGLDLSDATTDDLANLFSGNVLPNNANTFAQAYAGHQFGHYTILGDGRAVVLGDILQLR